MNCGLYSHYNTHNTYLLISTETLSTKRVEYGVFWHVILELDFFLGQACKGIWLIVIHKALALGDTQ